MLDAMLGFAAGVMLSVSAFGLILPALETGAVGIMVLGVLRGVILFGIADRLTPHLHFISGLEGPPSHLQRVAADSGDDDPQPARGSGGGRGIW